MPLIDSLQSWAKCTECGTILWCEISVHEQRCGCLCGGLILHDTEVTGTFDEAFTSGEMETVLQAGIL